MEKEGGGATKEVKRKIEKERGEIRGRYKRLGECGETMKDAVKIKRLPLITSSK